MLRHNLKARGHETAGQSHSSDTVGDELRAEMMAITREADPFNLDRPAVRHSGSLHSSGSPFASLKLATMEAYIESVKENFAMLYVDRLHPKRRHWVRFLSIFISEPKPLLLVPDGHEVEHVDALGLHPVHQPFKLGGEKTQDGRFQTAFIRDRIRLYMVQERVGLGFLPPHWPAQNLVCS